MAHKKQASNRRRRKEAVPVVGVVGISLSLAGGASAATAVPTADMPSRDTTASPQITLSEEETADVSLGTFYVFDKETAGTPRLGQQLARGCGAAGAAAAAEAAEAVPEPAEVVAGAADAAAAGAAAVGRGEFAAPASTASAPI